jgi:catechol 2,3-dioxygenase-like lactoylglutathione lyase family enzyme
MFQRVNAVVLFVQDFEKCLSFYRDTLGLEVVQLEPAFAAFRMKDHNFAISHVSEGAEMVNAPISAPPITGTQRIMLCAELENVDTAYERGGVHQSARQPALGHPRSLLQGSRSQPLGNLSFAERGIDPTPVRAFIKPKKETLWARFSLRSRCRWTDSPQDRGSAHNIP